MYVCNHIIIIITIFLKERTEIMMKDLTDKVINLLDDRSLEAVKVRLPSRYCI